VHFLALVYALFGHSPGAARIVQALLGAAAAALIGLIGWRLWGRRVGLMAAFLAAMYGPAVFFTGELVSATLELFLAACALWFLLNAVPDDAARTGHSTARLGAKGGARRARTAMIVLAGLALSLAAITRPTILPFAAAAAGWLWVKRMSPKAVALFAALVLSLPVLTTMRNGIVGRDWIFIASQGGINFYIGNQPSADGTTPNVPGAGSGIAGTYEAPARLASQALGRSLSPSEVSAYWFRRGLDFWVKKPARAVILFLKKIALTWNRRELPNLLDQKFFAPYESWLFRLRLLPGFALLAPIALAAAWIERRKSGLLLIYLIAFTLATAAFFACDRFRLPLAAAILPLAAAGLERLWNAFELRRTRPIATKEQMGSALVLVSAVALVWIPFPSYQKTETGMSWFRLARAFEQEGNLRHAGEAYAAAEKAGLATPTFFTDYGVFHLRNRDPFGAESLFRRALEQDLRFGPAHADLAELYLRRERWDLAAQEYEIAAGLIPERAAELYVDAGLVYSGTRQADRAKEMFQAALAARPGFAPALEGLARLQSTPPGVNPDASRSDSR
jgi:tetratricopeptide (TPR) repeat protein